MVAVLVVLAALGTSSAGAGSSTNQTIAALGLADMVGWNGADAAWWGRGRAIASGASEAGAAEAGAVLGAAPALLLRGASGLRSALLRGAPSLHARARRSLAREAVALLRQGGLAGRCHSSVGARGWDVRWPVRWPDAPGAANASAPAAATAAVMAAEAAAATAAALEALSLCGFVILRGLAPPRRLTEALRAFDAAAARDGGALLANSDGHLRGGRRQTFLPADAAPLLAPGLLRPAGLSGLLERYLGAGAALDVATLVEAPPGAAAQALHRDVKRSGSVALQLPLAAGGLGARAAPLSLCPGTHVGAALPKEATKLPLCAAWQVLAAPMALGDALLYDSATVHRGTAHHRGGAATAAVPQLHGSGGLGGDDGSARARQRPVLYLNFKARWSRGLGYEFSPLRTALERRNIAGLRAADALAARAEVRRAAPRLPEPTEDGCAASAL